MSMAIHLALGTSVAVGFGALGLDLGYANLAATQSQTAADAAALAGAISLAAGSDDLVAQAQGWAQLNQVGSLSIIVDDADVRRGDFDTARGVLTESAGGSDVWVRAHTEGSTAFLSRIWGNDTLDVEAVAVARVLPASVCTLIGLEEATVNGGSNQIIGYDSSIHLDPQFSADESAAVCSNGDIALHGAPGVIGSVRAGPGADIDGDTSNVTGSTADLARQLDYDPSGAPVGSVAWPLPYGITRAMILPPGDYVLAAPLRVTGRGSIAIAPRGAVSLYTASSVSISGGGIANPSRDPHDFSINVTSDERVTIGGTATFYGLVYAPTAQVRLDGTAAFYGAVISDDLVFNGGGRAPIYMDTSLIDVEQAGGVLLVR